LVRLRSLVPGAGQLLDLSFWARPRAMDGSDARVLWNAPYRRNSHALGDVRIAAHFSLFVYALPAPPAFVRAGSKVLDDRGRDLVHRPGSSHRPVGLCHLRQFVPLNRDVASRLRRGRRLGRRKKTKQIPRWARNDKERRDDLFTSTVFGGWGGLLNWVAHPLGLGFSKRAVFPRVYH
jgi:hypothetical protein